MFSTIANTIPGILLWIEPLLNLGKSHLMFTNFRIQYIMPESRRAYGKIREVIDPLLKEMGIPPGKVEINLQRTPSLIGVITSWYNHLLIISPDFFTNTENTNEITLVEKDFISGIFKHERIHLIHGDSFKMNLLDLVSSFSTLYIARYYFGLSFFPAAFTYFSITTFIKRALVLKSEKRADQGLIQNGTSNELKACIRFFMAMRNNMSSWALTLNSTFGVNEHPEARIKKLQDALRERFGEEEYHPTKDALVPMTNIIRKTYGNLFVQKQS